MSTQRNFTASAFLLVSQPPIRLAASIRFAANARPFGGPAISAKRAAWFAASLRRPVGFAPRPCDRFAFIGGGDYPFDIIGIESDLSR